MSVSLNSILFMRHHMPKHHCERYTIVKVTRLMIAQRYKWCKFEVNWVKKSKT